MVVIFGRQPKEGGFMKIGKFASTFLSAILIIGLFAGGSFGQGTTVNSFKAPLSVTLGGSGAATLTDHGVLVGSGTSAITPIAVGATGEVLIGNTGADPSWSGSPTLTTVKLTGLTDNYIPKHTSDATGLENSLLYQTGYSLMWQDTANTKNTYGFTINQLAADDEIISFKSSDVAHGITGNTETDTYAYFKKASATLGGVSFTGFSDGDATGVKIWGIIGNNNPTDTVPAMSIHALKKDAGGTDVTTLADAETAFQVLNSSTALLTILGNGNTGFGYTAPERPIQIYTATNDVGALAITSSLAALNNYTGIEFGYAGTRKGAIFFERTANNYRGDFHVALNTVADTAEATIADKKFTITNADQFYLRTAGVDHGMTDIAPTDAYGKIYATNTTAGGLSIFGLTDTDANPLQIYGVFGSDNPADTNGAVVLGGSKKSGTTHQALAAAETVLHIRNYSTDLLTILGGGNLILGTSTAVGTSAAKVLAISSGTAPTSSPADMAQIWTADHNGVAGYARLHSRPENVTYTPASPLALLSEVEIMSNPKAMSQAIATTYAAGSYYGPSVADNANLDNPTNNFAVFYKVRLADWTPSATTYFVDKYEVDIKGIRFVVLPDGKLFVRITSTISAMSTVATGLPDGAEAQVGVIITRETASTAGSVIFTVNGVQLGDAVPITAGATADISNAEPLYLATLPGGYRCAEVIHSCIVYNRALTAAEVLDLYRNGIAYADKWGSQTNIVTGTDADFSGAGNWVNTGCATFDVNTTVPGKAYVLGDGGNDLIYLNTPNPLKEGKRYRISLKARLNAGASTTIYAGRQAFSSSPAEGNAFAFTPTGIEATYSGEILPTADGPIYIGVATTGFNGIAFEFDDVNAVEIGATLALEGEGIQRDGWKDSTTNGLNASYPASGYSFLRPIKTDNAEGLLSVTTVSFAADGDTTLYTVPAGKRLVLTKAIVIAGADAASTDISIGQDTAETDWIGATQCDNLDAENDAIILQPVPAATSVKSKSYAAGTVIQMNVANHAGGATNYVHLFGYLY